MIKVLKLLAVILSLAVLVAGCNGGTSQDSLVGQPAPDFKFHVTEEQSVSLSDLQGSPVLLNFWATWCGPCASEMPYLQQVYDAWQEKGLVLLAINIGESYSEVEDFMQSRGLSFPVLLDSEGLIALQYGVSSIPSTFFIDSQGIVQHVQVGFFRSVADIESILSELD
jgi:cytochrome c biogenesis protein CcmG/thiol:disulfide interchange protein DsbE